MWEMIDFESICEVADTDPVGIRGAIGVGYDDDSVAAVD